MTNQIHKRYLEEYFQPFYSAIPVEPTNALIPIAIVDHLCGSLDKIIVNNQTIKQNIENKGTIRITWKTLKLESKKP